LAHFAVAGLLGLFMLLAALTGVEHMQQGQFGAVVTGQLGGAAEGLVGGVA
jgi:hypothetical protein